MSPEQTRQRVVDGAAEVFADLGFERARIADIAKAAGLSSGAMYNHFDSKAELLAAVVECHASNQLSALLTSGDVRGILDVIAARGQHLDRGPVEAPLLIEAVSAGRRDPEVLRVLGEQVVAREELFAQLIELGQAAGEVAADADAQALARFCLMLGLGSLLVRAMDLPNVNRAAWGALINRLVDGFRPEDTE